MTAASTPAPAGAMLARDDVRLQWPALDGLRGLSALFVFFYHLNVSANTSILPWGFLGVDVFFVLSGFLITRLLLIEQQHTGTVALKRFWIARAFRLLPAAYFVLLVITALLHLVLTPMKEFAPLWVVAAAAFYVLNWATVGQGIANAFGHYWSLSVEEQFYFVWPLLLLAVVPRGRRFAVCVIAGLFAAMAAASLYVVMHATTGNGMEWFFYMSFTRPIGLLVGALLAFWWMGGRAPLSQRAAVWLAVIGVVLFAAVAYGVHGPQDSEANRIANGRFLGSGGLLVAVSGITMVLAALLSARIPFATALLEHRVGRWLGRLSYVIYLVHVDILFVLEPATLGVALPVAVRGAIGLALTLVISAGIHRWIEKPFLRLRGRVLSPRASVAPVAA